MTPKRLAARLKNSALAFRGYNVTNLGRSRELLVHPEYGPIVSDELNRVGQIAGELLGREVDLEQRVHGGRETTLDTYADAIALILAMELAQLRLLREFFDIEYESARIVLGYSLGEIAALVASGVFSVRSALAVPLALSEDCIALADDVTLGILFSRGEELPVETVRRLCVRVNQEGKGVVGISAYLSPNSCLLMGQADTLDRIQRLMKEQLPRTTHLRKNRDRWPPLHTPITWLRNIPNRSGVLMHTLPDGLVTPKPPVLSLVTGKVSYNDYNTREIMQRWTDHPQRLWDAVHESLRMGIETVVHVGPAPNILPATYKRLHDNVDAQTRGSIGVRALSAVVRRPWLAAMLPKETALLRAPLVEQIVLEDWLLDVADPTVS